MNYDRIDRALQKISDTKKVVVGAGVIASVSEIFAEAFPDQTAVVVADDNTFAVAGKAVSQQLKEARLQLLEPFIFPGQPPLYADYQNVLKLETALRAHNAIPVVVGSGTLNDITKLASHRCSRPYMVVATAASMDGYTAFGAAITRDGFKQTFACPAPQVVVADVDILVDAPPAMTASGYGDLLGKITAGADWIIADALEIEAIDSASWSLVQDSLREWTASPDRLANGETQAFEYLIEGLALTGLAIQTYQTSRPASGSEHQFSHLWEMEGVGHKSNLWVSHGFKVGLGTIAATALYERLLARDLGRLDIDAVCQQWPTQDQVVQQIKATHSDPTVTEKAIEESLAKYIQVDALARRLTLLRDRWPTLRQTLTDHLLPAVQIRNLLQASGSPVDPAKIGIDRPQLQTSYYAARQIRRRYTIFDLAAESGCFEACVDELFSSDGFWGQSPTK